MPTLASTCCEVAPMPILSQNILVLALFLGLTPIAVSWPTITCPTLGCRHCRSYRTVPTLLFGGGAGLYELEVEAKAVLDESSHDWLSQLIEQRSQARWEGNYALADQIKEEIDRISLPDGYQLVIKDHPRREGGKTTWKLAYELPNEPAPGPGVLELAHSALGMVASCSERKVSVDGVRLQDLVAQAKTRLYGWSLVHEQLNQVEEDREDENDKDDLFLSQLHVLQKESNHLVAHWSAVEMELRGRKAADAAFWFALAGTTDPELFSLLVQVCTKEILRFGERPSCRVKDIMGIVERLAAAGVKDDHADDFLQTVSRCLQAKNENTFINRSNLLNLHSDHSAIILFNFATRQKKQKIFLETAAKHWERDLHLDNEEKSMKQDDIVFCIGPSERWHALFSDPSRPLVVDVGCGMGVSLLGLASFDASKNRDDAMYSDCNFIGVDLSALAIGYARGVAQRWGLSHRLAYLVDRADQLLMDLETYPGPIMRILIQFPTPYKLPSTPDVAGFQGVTTKSQGRNAQLPSSVFDGFMVTPSLLQQCYRLLKTKTDSDSSDPGTLLLQSNCEDVAVYVYNVSCLEAGFKRLLAANPMVEASGETTQRTKNWVAMGGSRAVGQVWSADPLLPSKGRTETEISCILNKTPVHRCILTAGNLLHETNELID